MTYEEKFRTVQQHFNQKGFEYFVSQASGLNELYENLGVDEAEFLDKATLFHSKINHDVPVITLENLSYETFTFSYLDQDVEEIISELSGLL